MSVKSTEFITSAGLFWTPGGMGARAVLTAARSGEVRGATGSEVVGQANDLCARPKSRLVRRAEPGSAATSDELTALRRRLVRLGNHLVGDLPMRCELASRCQCAARGIRSGGSLERSQLSQTLTHERGHLGRQS